MATSHGVVGVGSGMGGTIFSPESHGKTMGKPWENHGKTMGKPGFDVPQKTNPVITTVGTVTAGSKMTWPCVTMMCQCWRTTMRPLALETLFFRVEHGEEHGVARG